MKKRVKKKSSRIPKFLKKFKLLLVFFILLVVGFSLFLFKEKQATKTQTTSTTPVYPSISPISTANWKTYANRLYGFTIQYPPDYTIDCYECQEQVDDDIEWSPQVTFKSSNPLKHEAISLIFGSEDTLAKRTKNESIADYLKRQKTNNQEIASLTQETKVGKYDAVRTVFEFEQNTYMVRTQFFYKDGLIFVQLSDDLFADKKHTSMEKPIYEYPAIATYQQMLKTFKEADLPKTRKITSLYKQSTDGSYYVRKKPSGYGDTILLIDNKGYNIPFTQISHEGPFASLRCYECGVILGDWVNDYQFSVRLRGAFMDANDKLISPEYEYLINARTGKIEFDTFKQIK